MADNHPHRPAHRRHRRAALRAWSGTVLAVVLVTGLYFVVPLSGADVVGDQLPVRIAGLALGLTLLTWLVVRQVRQALGSGRRLGDRIATLLTLVDVVVVFFALGYLHLAEQFHGLSTRLDALYFAVTTLTTVGYGDITATGQAARVVVVAQMAFDLIIVTSATSIVVGAVRGPAPPRADEDVRRAGADDASGAGGAPWRNSHLQNTTTTMPASPRRSGDFDRATSS